jgi:alpha-mannosidase
MSVSEEGVVVSAVKPAHGRDGHVARMHEAFGKDASFKVSMPLLGREFTASLHANEVKTFWLPEDPSVDAVEVNLCEMRIEES